ncbi:50S ribosomal protein L6 [Umbelopsis sp. PMI_123]|jgi:large subunit ribosomal protein L6|nr:50S ribosomal protein L6 [Umbelopsis sp. PMI_123]
MLLRPSALSRFTAYKSVATIVTKRNLTSSSPSLSHIGRKVLTFPKEVSVEHDTTPITNPRIPSELNNTTLHVSGPLGKHSLPIKPFVNLNIKLGQAEGEDSELSVSVADPDIKEQRSMWGTTRALINNLVVGVTEGYKVPIRLVGVGYRATLEDNNRKLSLKLGYSHPVEMALPEGVTCTIPQPNRLILQGSDLQQVKELAAKIQRWRKPEPYNQKGIFIADETIKKKEGKKK